MQFQNESMNLTQYSKVEAEDIMTVSHANGVHTRVITAMQYRVKLQGCDCPQKSMQGLRLLRKREAKSRDEV